MDLDTIFKNMEDASVTQKGTFFNGGLYDLTLESIEYRDGFKGKSVIAKFKVDTSTNDQDGEGETRSWILKLDNPRTKEQAMGDIKQLIFALIGVDPASVGPSDRNPKAHKQAVEIFKGNVSEEYRAAWEKENGKKLPVLKGRKVKLEATVVVTAPTEQRPNGGKFTRHTWSPFA